jgi:NAD(P)H-hydrate epimerase
MGTADAAIAGVHLHAVAGELAAADLTPYCMMASDLIDYLPAAFKEVYALT